MLAPAMVVAEEAKLVLPAPVVSGSLLGGYLAGRIAQDEKDLDAASALYGQALERDPGNEIILKQAFLTEAEAGNWERADLFAEKVAGLESNYRLARIYLGAKAFKSANYALAEQHFKEAGVGPIGELTSTIARAWVLAAKGEGKAGIDLLDGLKSLDWASFYRMSHRALIADETGDRVAAGAAYKELFDQNPKIMSVALAYARQASRAGNPDLARQIIERHSVDGRPAHMLIEADLEALRRGAQLPPYLTSPADGLAEAFFGLGEALVTEGGIDIGTIYLQLALYLRPDNALTLSSLANVQEQTRQNERAIATYARIPASSPLSFGANLRRALNLSALERTDDAKAVLLELLKVLPATGGAVTVDAAAIEAAVARLPNLKAGNRSEAVRILQGLLGRAGYNAGTPDGAFGSTTVSALKALQKASGLPDNGVLGPQTRATLVKLLVAAETASARAPSIDSRIQVLSSLGNILRGTKEFEEASKHYSEAISLIGPNPRREQWSHYYSRAVCYERLKRWPEAEADFKKALDLDGEQPLVLNYLGYSWVDKNLNLEPALDMIRKAVKLKPEDGYFVDSLGWAYYRLARYPEAVTELERAVELKPDDPVINDHLGDAYWQAGRRLEARFQWAQSLTLKPEAEEIPKIEAKIRSGLAGGQSTGDAGSQPDPATDQKAAAAAGEAEPIQQQ